jgi:hypothetical protein
VAAQVRLGNYDVYLDQRGLRLKSLDLPQGGGNVPALVFTQHEEGRPPRIFRFQRLVASGVGSAEFHGFTTEQVALDGRLTYNAALNGFEVNVIMLNASEEMQARLTIHLEMPGEADPRWLIPGLFYSNNRPSGCSRVYPTFSQINRDLKNLISTQWAFRADRAASPMVCVWTYNRFAFIATETLFGRDLDPEHGIGMAGLAMGMQDVGPMLGVDFPYQETPIKFSYCQEDRTEPEETFVQLPENTPLKAKLFVGLGRPDLHAYQTPLVFLYNQANPEDKKVGQASVEMAEHYAHVGILRWHLDLRNEAIYEQATFDKHFGHHKPYIERAHMHTGWLSGSLPAYTLLWAGRDSDHSDSIEAGSAVLDKFAHNLAPCGTIFPVWTEENGWSCSFGPEDGSAHSRTVAEAIYYMLRATALEMEHNTSHPDWVEAILSSLSYAVGSQNEDGAFPSYYDLTTGRPINFDGCSGMAWIAPLVFAGALLQQPHLKEVAGRAGDHYAKYLQNAFLFGSVEDQAMVPTSDDCYWALISYMALYEHLRDRKWLELARKAANLAMTWRFSYNVNFPENTLLRNAGFKTRGGDISSVAAPVTTPNGLMIYRELLKLATFTGDEYYYQRAQDSRHFAAQLVATEDGQFNARQGMVVGQIYHTDWWQPKGIILSLSHVMSASLVKLAELFHRQMNIRPESVEWAKKTGEDVRITPVLYKPSTNTDFRFNETSDSLISKSARRLVEARAVVPGQQSAASHPTDQYDMLAMPPKVPVAKHQGQDPFSPGGGLSQISQSLQRLINQTDSDVGGTSQSSSSPSLSAPGGESPDNLRSSIFPIPDGQNQNPMPFLDKTPPTGQQPPIVPKKTAGKGKPPAEGAQGNDGVEIKYKIF